MDRSSIATVFGGSGFVGRYVVKRLAAAGHVVRVAGRNPSGAGFLRVYGPVGQVVPLFADLDREDTVERAVESASVVVNLVGVLAERRAGDFDRLQAEGAGRVARLAAAAGARSLVQVSAIGADPASPSAYGRSKARGEALVREHFPRAAILRPSIVFGAEDQFFNRFGSVAMFSPVMPVIAGGTRFQPVFVGDVADAVVASLERGQGTTYALGGPGVLTFREILAYILRETRRARPMVTVPDGVARLMARVPFSGLTEDQLKMLAVDNVVPPGAPGLEALGIAPTPIDLVVPEYLVRYRRGGRQGAPNA